ncbi:MAG: ABC transporter substrate-binding protein [Rhodocyclaceae bacterium]
MTMQLKKCAAALVVAGVMAAIGAPAVAATPKDQLIVGMNMVNLTSMDPHNTNSFESYHVLGNVYDTLVRADPKDPGKLLPGVAQSWTVAADGAITFKLRSDVKFHTGRAMTADDVAYSLRRAVKLGLLGSSYFVQWGYNAQNVDTKFVAKDATTFVMEPALPLAANLKLFTLARVVGSILDKETVTKNEKDGDMGRGWLASHAAGSGPFSLAQWNPNDVLFLNRAEGYWGGNAKLKRVVVRHLPESQNERLQLEKGDLDVGFQLVSADIDGLAQNKGIVIDRLSGSGFYYLLLNMKDPDFAKPAVRKALRYCVNYKGINASVMKNYGESMTTMVPADVPGYVAGIGNKFDPDKCKKDLAAAGYPNGMKKQLLALSSVPYADLATAIQQNFAKASVQVEIRTGNGDQAYGPLRNRTFEMGVGRTASAVPTDADSWLRTHVYNPDNSDGAKLENLQGWRSSFFLPEVNKLIEDAAASSDEKKRVEMYSKALKLAEDAGPSIFPISRRVDPYARSARLRNYVGNPNWMTRWDVVDKAN